jgi:hypothetical protein
MNLAVLGDFPGRKLKKMEGGQSPVRVVQEFLLEVGASPLDDELKSVVSQNRTWQVQIPNVGLLTVELENSQRANDAILTFSFPLMTVSIKDTLSALIAALELSKPLVGCRLYLEENRLIIAASICGDVINLDSLSLHYELIKAQKELLMRSLQKYRV